MARAWHGDTCCSQLMVHVLFYLAAVRADVRPTQESR
jgi:hypothetical protein